ncbi:unnamed protein product [Owenia fusiformis]|uniref:BTB domain-containing protein n=1 Tax=Owenia fusiformis TaxID=6347 RepID=A0A8S4NZ79_OWEFU|nr:unnamed protein product [Owenia fusiformis]
MSMAPSNFSKSENKVIINVGGIRYETFKTTLKNIPDTRLSWLTDSSAGSNDYDPVSKEYFFDRHPGIFNMIMNYYRTGKLHAPTDVCGPLFEEELSFWGIDEKQIEPCCWMTYRTHRDAEETLAEFEQDMEEEDDDEDEDIAARFGIEEVIEEDLTWWQRNKSKLWNLLDDPGYSKAAQVIAFISMFSVIFSIILFVCETHLLFRVPSNETFHAENNITWDRNWNNTEKRLYTKAHPVLDYLDYYVCTVYFTLELIIRIISCPDKKVFFKSVTTWVDIISIVPVYINLIIVTVDSTLTETHPAVIALKVLRIVRILRIMKLTKHISGLVILVHTIRASLQELLLLILFICFGMLTFACLIYYLEQIDEDPQNSFTSIPIGFWWAIVTMTTLGYGDKYPRSVYGYMLGSICSICGVLVIALPVPVIVNNFALYYSHAQARLKLPKKRKKYLVGNDLKMEVAPVDDDMDLDKTDKDDDSVLSIEPPKKMSDLLRKNSNGSQNSADSGIAKSVTSMPNQANNSKEKNVINDPKGISVVFTDEQTKEPVSFRNKPRIPPKIAPMMIQLGGSRSNKPGGKSDKSGGKSDKSGDDGGMTVSFGGGGSSSKFKKS